jgi:hypothetical protein
MSSQETLIDPENETVISRDELRALEDELHFLRWFYQTADFGPADGDVRMYFKRVYVNNTGKNLPDRYRDEEE